MKVRFYRSADAFLYLPTYIAEHCGIYDQIDRTLDVKFPDASGSATGDLPALKAMLERNKRGDAIPIAICDPFVMFGKWAKDSQVLPTDLRVLGAIITKVPFWAVDSTEGELAETQFGRDFKRIVFYNDNLLTGNYIGVRSAYMGGIDDKYLVNFGDEFDVLFKKRDTKTLAVTCDVVAMALHHDPPDDRGRISVNHCYATNPHYENYITTALITTAEVCKRHPERVTDILRGIQASLAVLRTSQEVAVSVCMELVEKKKCYSPYQMRNGLGDLKEPQVRWMVKSIYDGNFYPRTLEISTTQWNESLERHAKANWMNSEAYEAAKPLYETIVDSSFYLAGQMKYVEAIVDLDKMIKKEVDARVGTIDALVISRLEEERSELEEKKRAEFAAKKLSRYFISAGKVLSAVGVLSLIAVFFYAPTYTLVGTIAVGLIAFFPLVLFFIWLFKRTSGLNTRFRKSLLACVLSAMAIVTMIKGISLIDESNRFEIYLLFCSFLVSAATSAWTLVRKKE